MAELRGADCIEMRRERCWKRCMFGTTTVPVLWWLNTLLASDVVSAHLSPHVAVLPSWKCSAGTTLWQCWSTSAACCRPDTTVSSSFRLNEVPCQQQADPLSSASVILLPSYSPQRPGLIKTRPSYSISRKEVDRSETGDTCRCA